MANIKKGRTGGIRSAQRGDYSRPSYRALPRVAFHRELLPCPSDYYREQGLNLAGGGEWKCAICPFHADNNPSLRVRLDTGCFCCMACGARGGDILAFHMKRYGFGFVAAAKALGAWMGG